MEVKGLKNESINAVTWTALCSYQTGELHIRHSHLASSASPLHVHHSLQLVYNGGSAPTPPTSRLVLSEVSIRVELNAILARRGRVCELPSSLNPNHLESGRVCPRALTAL
jgi:hypothetical protein